MSIITIVAAVGENRELGKDNKLLWKLPADLEHFRVMTKGHPVIMGRKTFQSIGHALPDRINIVISRNPRFSAPNVISVTSLEEAIEEAQKSDEKIFIIGGQEIFALALPLADRLVLTQIKASFSEADTYFPPFGIEWDIWEVQSFNKNHENKYDFSIVEYYRNTQLEPGIDK